MPTTKVSKRPYKIKPFPIPTNPRLLKPFTVWLFLRIEALLRSPQVWKFYRQGGKQGAPALWQQYNFRWSFFTGGHHYLLDTSRQYIDRGLGIFPADQMGHEPIIDLQPVLDAGVKVSSELDTPRAVDLLSLLMSQFPHALFLMIIALYPDKVIHEVLDKYLVQQRERLRQREPASQQQKGKKDHLALYKAWSYQKLPDLHT